MGSDGWALTGSAPGQIGIEYFVLFALIALFTLVSLTKFDDEIRDHYRKGFFDPAVETIAGPNTACAGKTAAQCKQ